MTPGLRLEIAAEAARNPRIAEIVHAADTCSLASLRQTIAVGRRNRGLSDDEGLVAEIAETAASMFDGLVIRGVRSPDIDREAITRRFTQLLRSLFLT